MKYLLDANVIILLLGGFNEKLRDRVMQCSEGELCTSAIAFAEVALGSWNGKKPPLVVIDQLPRAIAVVPFDELAARQYARLPFKRGSFDRLIAAHAIALNLPLVSDNVRHFADIPGLRVENWTE